MQAWRCGVRRQEPWHLFPANMTFRFYVHSRYTPGIPEGWAEFKTNSEGIRARERELERWDSVFSILCLGASTTENIVLDEGKHWPAVLERRLQSVSSGPVWVGNAGKSGYSTRRVARVAAEYIPRTRPKAVVLLTGFNEGITPDEAGPDGTRPGEGAWAAFEEGIERVAMYRSLKWLLFSQARLSPYDRPIPADNLWVAWERAQARRRWRTQLDRRWDDIDLRSFEADILRIYELCLRYGSRLVLCTQPTLYKEKMSAQEDAAMWLMGDITDRSRAEKMRHVNERLRRMSRKYDIPLVDLDRILPKSLEMFFDDCHFTQKGSDRVAEALSGYFERTLLLPASR
jgi:lysophospholipase L1-like esterase